MSDASELERKVERLKQEIEREVYDRLPRKVGIVAVNHFKQNFREGGFVDGGVKLWKRTRRQDGGGTDAKYSPLTSRRDHLMRSIQAEPGRGEVTITNPVEYAAIHNEGGTVETSPTVTPKMRKMAWRKCYALAGVKGKGKLPKKLPEEAEKWRALALTKTSKLHIKANIPQRQFIGESKELLRKKVASRFGLSVPVFTSWITVVTLTRNSCYHHSRVWNKENAICPMIPRKIKGKWINSEVTPKRIFYNICIIKWFVNIVAPNNDMLEHLQKLFAQFPMVDIHALGFPKTDWLEEPLWASIQSARA